MAGGKQERVEGAVLTAPKHYRLRKGKPVKVPGTNVTIEAQPKDGKPGVLVTVEGDNGAIPNRERS